MAFVVPAMMIVTAAASVYGAYSSYQAGKENEKLRDEQARIARAKAQEQARRHRIATEKLLSRQRAAYAAGGVSFAGTPQIVQLATAKEAEAERQKILELGGMEASYLENVGDAEYQSGLSDAFSYILEGAGTMLGGLNRPGGNPWDVSSTPGGGKYPSSLGYDAPRLN